MLGNVLAKRKHCINWGELLGLFKGISRLFIKSHQIHIKVLALNFGIMNSVCV